MRRRTKMRRVTKRERERETDIKEMVIRILLSKMMI